MTTSLSSGTRASRANYGLPAVVLTFKPTYFYNPDSLGALQEDSSHFAGRLHSLDTFIDTWRNITARVPRHHDVRDLESSLSTFHNNGINPPIAIIVAGEYSNTSTDH